MSDTERHRQEVTRTLVEQAFLGFLALDDAGKQEFIERFNRFHQNLGHRDAARYEIRDTRQ